MLLVHARPHRADGHFIAIFFHGHLVLFSFHVLIKMHPGEEKPFLPNAEGISFRIL